MVKIKWENIEIEHQNPQYKPSDHEYMLNAQIYNARRAKVPGGWLVISDTDGGRSMTFVPDPKHEWK